MGNPYALNDLATLANRTSTLLVAYQDDFRTCEAVADALCGIEAVQGRLPISPTEGPWRAGDGMDWDGNHRLGRLIEGRRKDWNEPSLLVDSILEVALDEGAIPGARVLVAHQGNVVIDKTVGTLDGKAPVLPESVYDLASITKVAATANALMTLCANDGLDLGLADVTIVAKPGHP